MAAHTDEYTSVSQTYLNTEHSDLNAHDNISQTAQQMLSKELD